MHTVSKIIIWLFLVCSSFLGFGGNSIPPVIENYPVIPKTTELRKQLLAIAQNQVGVRELTGNNDGKQIKEYLKSVGLKEGYPWCVAFVVWCHLQISYDFPIPITAWSPALFTHNLVYHKNHIRMSEWIPRGGEAAGIYYASKKRIAHAVIIERKQSNHFITYEGNTSLMGAILDKMNLSREEKEELDRDGIWVAKKIRKQKDIYVASDYIGGKEITKALRQKDQNKYFNNQ
jgi:hypothetical protein